jgi:hypothetical protein
MLNNSIGTLQTSINVRGRDYAIRHDFRPCLDIMVMFEDVELTDNEKIQALVEILFEEEPPLCEETIIEAMRFLDNGKLQSDGNAGPDYGRLYSWTQDSSYIFSAIDRILGFSSRRCEYLHWWEFMGAFMEIGECMFSTLVHLRKQKKRGRLTKEEREYWAENKGIMELKEQLTKEEQSQIDRFLELAKGGNI